MTSIGTRPEHRRCALRGSTVAGLFTVMLMLTACTGGEEQAPAGDSLTREPVPPATAELDEATWIIEGEPASLDPIYDYAYYDQTVVSNMCESLEAWNPDMSRTDGLATSERVDDVTFKYTLRPGVSFWDGTPLTAEDVVYSLKRNQDPDLGSYFASPADIIKSVRATADDEVTVVLKDRSADWLASVGNTGFAIVSKTFVERTGKKFGSPQTGVMCTGPYKFDRWTPGDSIVLERNDSYWNKAAVAKTKTLTFNFRGDSSAQANSLVSGAAQGMYVRDPGIVSRLKESSGKVFTGPNMMFQYIIPTTRPGPLRDADVRRALSMAIDREAIARVVFQGTAHPMKSLVAQDTWGQDPDVRSIYEQADAELPPIEVDIEGAKDLLEGKDVSQPVTLAYPTQGGEYQQKLATVIQQSAKGIGLNMKLMPLSPSVAASLYQDPKGMVEAGIDVVSITFNAESTDPLGMYTTFDPAQKSIYNYSNFEDPTVTERVQAARREYDPLKRAKLVTQAQAAVMDLLPVIPLVATDTILYLGDGVTGPPASFSQIWSPWANLLGRS